MAFNLGNEGNGTIYFGEDGRVHLKGKVFNVNGACALQWWAGNPADHLTSYSGSGLPFPSPQIAYENTPNYGKLDLVAGNNGEAKFEFALYGLPNAYYVGNGTIYLSPRIQIRLAKNGTITQYEVPINGGIPFRHLTYVGQPNVVARAGPEFYQGRFNLPFGTQEDILRRSAYPKTYETPPNFWGLATPHP